MMAGFENEMNIRNDGDESPSLAPRVEPESWRGVPWEHESMSVPLAALCGVIFSLAAIIVIVTLLLFFGPPQ
jgi:hypothetical protein